MTIVRRNKKRRDKSREDKRSKSAWNKPG